MKYLGGVDECLWVTEETQCTGNTWLYKVINRIEHLDDVQLPYHADSTRYEVKSSVSVWAMTGKLSTVWTVLYKRLGLRQNRYIFSSPGKPFTLSELLGFWTLSIIQYSRNYKTQRFGKWICLRPQMSGEASTLLGPFERANLNHWTQQSRCLIPPPPHQGTESDPVSETLCFLASRI
jgi:hypothetical protein